MNARQPLVPEDRNRQNDPVRALARACWSHVVAAARNRNATTVAGEMFRDDPLTTAILQRAAQPAAGLSDPAWAGLLAATAVGQFLPSLAPASAAAALMPRGTRVAASALPLSVPILMATPTAAPWVAEFGATPVRAFTFGSVPIDGRKLGVIVAFSRELAGIAGAQSIFDGLLRQVASISLDLAYFSTVTGSASAHAGLLAGLTPLAGSADMADDLAKLAGTVGPGSSGPLVYVMAPGRAAIAAIRAPEATVTILSTLAAPTDRVICLDPVALIHEHGPDPEITASESALVNMADPAASALTAPSVSSFQTAQVVLRLTLDIAFAARRVDAVAYLDGATW